MWITSKGLCQEKIVDPRTGLTKIVSVKVKGSGKKAEQEAYKKLEEKISKLSDVRILLSKLIELYELDQEKSVKASTMTRKESILKSFFEVYGECYVETITAGNVRQKLMASGKSNRTLNMYLREFKTLWRWAYQNDYVKSTEVSDKLKAFADTPEKLRIQDKYLEPNELKTLLDAMENKRYKLVSRFLALSGLRIGEFCCLTNQDVWSKNIIVNKTYDHINKIVTSPKTLSSNREVYIQPELRECIKEIQEYAKWQQEICGYENTNLLLPDPDGGYFCYVSYDVYLRNIGKKVLQKSVSPHIFRHTHASYLALKGFDLTAISNRLGHEDSAITKAIYLHRMEEMKERENRQLDSIRFIV